LTDCQELCYTSFVEDEVFYTLFLKFPSFVWNWDFSFIAPGLIDTAMLRMYQVLLMLPWYRFIFPCVPYKYYY